MLSHLEHVFGFQLIEGHVIEAVKRFRMNSRTMAWIRGFEARKGELQLRTCVYSRYASLKPTLSNGFAGHRPPLDWPWTTGKAIKTMVFAEGRNIGCVANKNHHFFES